MAPRTLVRLAGALFALGLVVTASGTSSASGSSPVHGGTLRIDNVIAPTSLDPATGGPNTIVGGDIGFDIFGGLVYWNRTTNQINDMMATSVTTSDDGTTWTINIRKNVKFTDGTPYNAAAVIDQWKRVADPTLASQDYPLMQDIASYSATGPLTIKVVLKAQNTQWEHTLAEAGLNYIGSPTAVQKEGKNFGNDPVGAGPFVLQKYVPGTSVSLVRNPHYWDQPLPYLHGIVETFIASDTTREQALETHEADIAIANVGTAISAFKTIPSVSQKTFFGGMNSGLSMNTTLTPTNNANVRKAISLALDYSAIAQAWGSTTVDQLFPKQSPYYEASQNQKPQENLQEAQTLINQYVAQTGHNVNLTYEEVQADQGAQVIQANLQRLKHVTVTRLHPVVVGPQYVSDLADNKVMMTMGERRSTSGSCEPSCYDEYHSGTNVLNYWKLNDPTVNKLLGEARTVPITDTAKLKTIYNQFQTELRAQYLEPALFPYENTPGPTYPTVHNVQGLWDGTLRTDVIWLSSSS